MDFILDFKNTDKTFLSRVGGKNASLGEMIKAGIRVPPGFAVTTDSYQHFITETGIEDAILGLLAGLDVDDVASLNKASERIQELMKNASMPENVHQAIREGYGKLCRIYELESVPVAVRSSATAEDLPTASFAGQQDTYLWIQGADQVVENVKRCWASLFTPRAISYRVKNNFPHEKVLISIGVQKMVNSKAAGVMFTINPINGDRSEVAINASWGLGESVVSGKVTPDEFLIDKVTLKVKEKILGEKAKEMVPAEEGGVVTREVDKARQETFSVTEEEITELVKIGIKIEENYKNPSDIEWAIDNDMEFPNNIFILQARPETVWSSKEKQINKVGSSTDQLADKLAESFSKMDLSKAKGRIKGVEFKF